MFKNFDGYSEDSFYNIETFSDSNLEQVTVIDAHKSLPLRDVACETKCTNGTCDLGVKNNKVSYICSTNNESFAYLKCEGDGDNRKCYNEKNNSNGLCSNGIGGPVYSGLTKTQCLNLPKNSKQYTTPDSSGNQIVIKDHVKEGLVYRENTTVDKFYNFDKCKSWLDDPNKKEVSEECLQQIWNDTGCNPRPDKRIQNSEHTDKKNFKQNYLDLQYWRGNGCGEYGISTTVAKKVSDIAEDKINLNIDTSSKKLETIGPIQKRMFENIVNIKGKLVDKINSENELVENFSDGTGIRQNTLEQTKKYNNFNLYIMEIVKAYKDAIIGGVDKLSATNILKRNYKSFLDDGTVAAVIGPQNIKAFEQSIKQHTGVDVNEPITEGIMDGADYDENGNLREHQNSQKSCYLITALTKAKLLSIGQVYQLRKLMLEAFKVETNRPFFHFYYNNFGSVADMLVKQNRLSEILPNMLKCIDLSKNGQFDLAFEQYIMTARQAYQICKDMGMDTKDLEDKFDKLDGTISQLPEPNNLFVENGFREALESC